MVLTAGTVWALTGTTALAFQQVGDPAGKPEAPKVEPPPRPSGEEMGPPAPPDAKEQAEGARKLAAGAVQLDDEPQIPVSGFLVEYDRAHPSLPSVDQLLTEAVVFLRAVEGGWAAPTEDDPGAAITVADLNQRIGQGQGPGQKFSKRALATVLEAIRGPFKQRSIIGILIEADPEDLVIERAGEKLVWTDLREGERATLRLRVFAVTVNRVTTAASGSRIRRPADIAGTTMFYDRLPSEAVYDLFNPPNEDQSLIDNPAHDRIRKASPVQPASGEEVQSRRDLLRQDELDDFTLRLNRYANRRVDVTVTGAEEPNEVVLMYLVRENNPLMIYTQVSNTGTEQTNVWRERVGFEHTQLTNSDDTLSVDFVTGWGKSNVLNAFYDRPLDESNLWRFRVQATYTDFDASEVGIALEQFTGRSFTVGGEVSRTLWQGREQFLDAFAGLRWEREKVNNQTFNVVGETDFLIPKLGLRFASQTDEATTALSLHVEGNMPGLAGTSASEVVKLGRPGAQTSWVTAIFAAEQSFFLEPLLDREAWLKGESTLAHELWFSVKGQFAFDNRLAPTFEQVAGGLYTVRGYDESIVSGDTVVVGSAEYRLHIPRLLNVQEEPGQLWGKQFRWAPQQPYGRPDWDLIFRGFFDCARTINSKATSFEQNETLMGTGIGLELLYRRNVNIRLDWGCALRTVPGKASAGDSRLHFVATFLF